MNNRSFDKNFVIAILAAGIGIMFYDALQISFKFWSQAISFDDFNKEIPPKVFAGISVALFYAIITRKKSNQKETPNLNKEKF